ncbi:MAG: TolC family protein [Methylococcaceae bacterium]|uniref:TolC family protein n=1 Tax=Methylicorpusculum sp. TaxID=2713644 RepID=UPI00274CF6A9|nr:TolC family protein [Methylicorpusculum sp.]MDP3392040.1 TolC family protein [Methylococcaceae bacterium]MDP3931777.1 TolC family protein [Methylococcaceae bacterium]MDZ4153761.1 TolC family protein [Methylicorpusculum sp.]MDZ4218859.1 TolC family protein [Methylobacter sp.]
MSSNYVRPLGVALCLLITTCQVDASPTNTTQSLSDQTSNNPNRPAAEEPTGSLVLSQALALALTQNPELSAYSWESRAQEAATLQAGLFPNPTFNANAANFGNRVIQGFDGDVVTLELSQLIELGGKRTARIEAAALTKQLADWDYEAKRADVLTQVTQAFIDVLAAQQRLALTQQTHDLANQTAVTTAARVQAGKVSPVEETKAKVARASVQIELMRARKELEAARKRLVAGWGSTTPRFESVAGNLDSIPAPSSLDSLQQRLSKNPDLARWATEITQRQALIVMEKSKAIPDVTATVGASQYLMPNDYALVVGFSVPLPVFDRNQGRIQEAEHRLTKAEQEMRNTEVRITTALNTAYQALDAAHSEIMTLRQEILPGAQSAYDAAREGYRLGKFGFLDVLDAQRTLFGAKNQYLVALANYHKSVADVERLVGSGMNETVADSQPEVSR